MGSLAFDLGPVQYDNDLHPQVPLAAQIGLAAGAAVVCSHRAGYHSHVQVE